VVVGVFVGSYQNFTLLLFSSAELQGKGTLTEVGMKRSQNGSQRDLLVNKTASNSTDSNGAPTLQTRRRRNRGTYWSTGPPPTPQIPTALHHSRQGGGKTDGAPLHGRLQKKCRLAKKRRQAPRKNQVS
jgi:hypothetical protein